MRRFPYIGLAKLAEGGGSDPNLQRASEIFEDWLVNRKYQVRRGETLSGIAARSGVPMEELMDVNGLASAFVKPGQILRIPSGFAKGKGGSDAGGVR